MKNLNKMKIAGDMQFEIGQDKVSHFPAWEIKDDKTLCKKVEDLKHSTFDKSKFTVVGSPTITDDGIASGFSGNNYIKAFNDNFIFSKPFKVRQRFKVNSFAEESFLFAIQGGVWHNRVSVTTSGFLGVFLAFSDGTNGGAAPAEAGKLLLNTWYEYEFSWNGNVYNLKLFLNNRQLYSYDIPNSSPLLNTETAKEIVIGRNADIDVNYAQGSIDLKQFSITVDGKEVFNGNKTGIDNIKADNYEVVGSPVISDDGIASGFSSSNYIRISPNINVASKNYEIEIPFVTSDRETLIASTLVNSGSDNASLSIASRGHYDTSPYCLDVFCGGLNLQGTTKLEINTNYIVKFIRTATQYIVKLLNLDTNIETTEITFNKTDDLTSLEYIYLGTPAHWPNKAYKCTYDLNAFKIYVDGNLVYQPCLKIPYTLSKTGSKIVDGVYRDRVIDLYEQEGYTHYYTIGENDFTLATCKGSDVIAQGEAEGIVYTKTADLTLTQRGNCTSGSVVNLLPYKDENSYHVSTPYTAKTSNSFTPSADGDFIAVGKCFL